MDERIEINPKIMVGKPIIKGTRITVEHILNLLAHGVKVEEITSDKYYPHLKKEDIYAAIAYAQSLVEEEKVYPLRKISLRQISV